MRLITRSGGSVIKTTKKGITVLKKQAADAEKRKKRGRLVSGKNTLKSLTGRDICRERGKSIISRQRMSRVRVRMRNGQQRIQRKGLSKEPSWSSWDPRVPHKKKYLTFYWKESRRARKGSSRTRDDKVSQTKLRIRETFVRGEATLKKKKKKGARVHRD